jgi:hypothetical protein
VADALHLADALDRSDAAGDWRAFATARQAYLAAVRVPVLARREALLEWKPDDNSTAAWYRREAHCRAVMVAARDRYADALFGDVSERERIDAAVAEEQAKSDHSLMLERLLVRLNARRLLDLWYDAHVRREAAVARLTLMSDPHREPAISCDEETGFELLDCGARGKFLCTPREWHDARNEVERAFDDEQTKWCALCRRRIADERLDNETLPPRRRSNSHA